MEKNGVTKVTVSLPSELIGKLPGGELPPEWLRVSFIDEDSPYRDIDKVYLPIEPFGNSLEMFLCACADSVPMMQDDGHTYVPASWLMRQCPDLTDQIEMIVQRVLELNQQDESPSM